MKQVEKNRVVVETATISEIIKRHNISDSEIKYIEENIKQ